MKPVQFIFRSLRYTTFAFAILLFTFCKKTEVLEDPIRLNFGSIDTIQIPTIQSVFEDISIPRSPIYTDDGHYVFIGSDQNLDIYLTKITRSMNVVWSTKIGPSMEFDYTEMKKTSDNGYIIYGQERVFLSGLVSLQTFAIKLDENANITWKKRYDGSNSACLDLIQLNNGDYLMAGYAQENAYLRRIDTNGEEIWKKSFQEEMETVLFSICPISNNQFIASGAQDNENSSQIFTIKFDELGTELERHAFGKIQYSFEGKIFNINSTTSTQNGCIIASRINKDLDPSDILLTKIDQNGREVWTKVFDDGGNEIAINILAKSDGDNLMIAEFEHQNERKNLLINIDSNGDWLWAKKYEGLDRGPRFISTIPSGGFLISGTIQEANSGKHNSFFLEIDENGIPR